MFNESDDEANDVSVVTLVEKFDEELVDELVAESAEVSLVVFAIVQLPRLGFGVVLIRRGSGELFINILHIDANCIKMMRISMYYYETCF